MTALRPIGVIETNAQRERIAAIETSTRRTALDEAESRLTSYDEDVVGHDRLSQPLQGERADLFGYDTSLRATLTR